VRVGDALGLREGKSVGLKVGRDEGNVVGTCEFRCTEPGANVAFGCRFHNSFSSLRSLSRSFTGACTAPVGMNVGVEVGSTEGACVATVGKRDDGESVGLTLGAKVGMMDGHKVGENVGVTVWCRVGNREGVGVGVDEGSAVGVGDLLCSGVDSSRTGVLGNNVGTGVAACVGGAVTPIAFITSRSDLE
jgi:hypothetical protein